MSKRVFAIGDIHGKLSALNEVLDVSGFDDDNDQLITMGDVVDGGEHTKCVVDRLLQIKDRIDIRGNHDCLTPDAEALTQKGWVKYTDLTTDDKVYSYDTENGVGKWMPITRVIIKEHDGNMVKIDTNRFRMMVTPTHRVLCSKRNISSKGVCSWSEYQYIRAREINSRICIPSCISDNNKEFDISDDKIRMTAWTLTDGHIEKNHGYVCIYQSKQKGCKKIESVLIKLNYEYTRSTRTRSTKSICGKTLINPQLPSVEYKLSAKDSKKILEYIHKKGSVPPWVFNLSKRQFDIFLDTLIDGDGSKYNRGGSAAILYGEEHFLSSVQSACVTKGYTATISTDNRGSPRLNICSNKTIEFDCYLHVSAPPYNGTVWCVETPLTNFMVRYKGTCYFTGNSWFMGWMDSDPRIHYVNYIWQEQGGYATQRSYDYNVLNIPESHKDFFRNQVIYYIDKKNNIFVHGGFDPEIRIDFQEPEFIMWDRDLIKYARKYEIKEYNKVFVGHTTVQFYNKNEIAKPLIFNNLVMTDCGGGWNGRLAMINVEDTNEYYTSKKQRKPR